MDKLNVSFARHTLSKLHTPDRWTGRTININKVGDKFRLMATDAERYLLFYGEVPAKSPTDETPPASFANELTQAEADEGRTRIIEGKQYIVSGYGGVATVAGQRTDVETLSMPIKGMHEISVQSNAGPAVIRKIGDTYQVFVVQGEFVTFFAEAEVGPGFPTVTLKNRLTLQDVGAKKIFDGKQYGVGGHGGDVKIEPQWFDGARPLN